MCVHKFDTFKYRRVIYWKCSKVGKKKRVKNQKFKSECNYSLFKELLKRSKLEQKLFIALLVI